MKNRLHINVVKFEIDMLFSIKILSSERLETDRILGSLINDGKEFLYKAIDTNDKQSLNKIAEFRLSQYLGVHPDNTKELFVETAIERAKDFQSYFPNYRINPVEKTYYYSLARWIEFLQSEFGIIRIRGNKDLREMFTKSGNKPLNPTYNFDLLKPHRYDNFIEAIESFIIERANDEVETSMSDINLYYKAWLVGELEAIEQWLSKTFPNGEIRKKLSNSEIIEIGKYKDYINCEIDRMNKLKNDIALKVHYSDNSVEQPHKYDIQLSSVKKVIDSSFNYLGHSNEEWSLIFKLFFLRADSIKYFGVRKYDFSVREFLEYHGACKPQIVKGLLKLVEFNFKEAISHEMFNSHKKFILESLNDILKDLNDKVEVRLSEVKDDLVPERENDFIKSTIDDWLFEFKDKITNQNYDKLVYALTFYIKRGEFPILDSKILINGRPNKKLVGWAINRILEANGRGVDVELLIFAKDNISLFKDVSFNETNFRESNLYKYFTTKTQ